MADPILLKDYPLVINNVEIPFAKSDSGSFNPIENTNISETGKDIVQISRDEKITKTYSTRLTSNWETIFRNFSKSSTPLKVKMFDIGTQGYIEYDMRLRDLNVKKVPKSEDLEISQGVYDFSFKLIQF